MATRPPVPGQSNDPNPARRTMENALIRQLRMSARLRANGLPDLGGQKAIKRMKKKLY